MSYRATVLPMEYKSRSVRLDDEVWAAVQSHELSANRLLRRALKLDRGKAVGCTCGPRQSEVASIVQSDFSCRVHGGTFTPEIEKRIAAQVEPRVPAYDNIRPPKNKRAKAVADLAASDLTAQAVGRDDIEYGNHEETPRGQHVANIGKRPIREKGDRTR